QLDPTQALGDYFETYVERDVRQLSEVRNLAAFERFVRLVAGRAGQLVNASSLGSDAGVSHTTASEWLSLLEASFVIFRLPPYFANLKKRLVKSPKIYFIDVGLAAYLLGIESPSQLYSHPLRGALFENLVISEAVKMRYNQGKKASNLYFYRDSGGLEVDLLISRAHELLPVEIKSSATLSKSFFQGLGKLTALLEDQVLGRLLVHDGDATFQQRDTTVTHPKAFVKTAKSLLEA
ncbi:MAG: DUF4143 domain-containing protein, partial [Acidobacteriota bacterium]